MPGVNRQSSCALNGNENRPEVSSPVYAGCHGCQAVEECAAGVLRSLGEGGHASTGFAEDTRGTTAVKPWGSTIDAGHQAWLRGFFYLC